MEQSENAESIIDIFSRIAAKVPAGEWARLPTDLSKNLDHYLYGTKKLTE
jgi:hypothetical protein